MTSGYEYIASETCIRHRGKEQRDGFTTTFMNGNSNCPAQAMYRTPGNASCQTNGHSQNGIVNNQCDKYPDAEKTQERKLPEMFSATPSARMQELLEGLNAPGDCGNPTEPPPWLDKELFKCGRNFYYRYLFCMSFSEMLSLVFMFTMTRALRPLMYTGRSDTPRKALRRYFSTFQHVTTWHEGDVWNTEDSAHKDILSVRGVHNRMSEVFNSSQEHDKVWTTTIQKKGHEEPSCPFYPYIREDLKDVAGKGLTLEGPDNPPFYISQWDMSLTQYQFMGLIVAHPDKLGASAATDRELEGLIHFWRGLGWLLGIDDKYNFCRGTLAEVRSLCLEVEKLVGIPGLAKANWDYEHMATSLVTGLSYMLHTLSFEASFRYLAYVLDLDVSKFVSRMSFVSTLKYWSMRFGMAILYLFPGLVGRFSRNLRELTKGFKRRYAKGMNEQGGNQTGELYPVTTSFDY